MSIETIGANTVGLGAVQRWWLERLRVREEVCFPDYRGFANTITCLESLVRRGLVARLESPGYCYGLTLWGGHFAERWAR